MSERPSFRVLLPPRSILACCLVIALSACSNEAARRRHFENGRQYLQANQPREAVIELRNAIEGDEQWGEARRLLAEAYAASGEPERALRQYIRAADLLPDDDDLQVTTARYLLVAGQYEDAKSRAERVLARRPAHVEAQIALGHALAGLRDIEGAIARINEAIQLDPSRSASYASLAVVQNAQGDPEAARAAFEQAVATDGASVEAHLALANFLWSSGETAEAEAALQRAYALDNGHPLTNRVLATFYQAMDRPDRAERHLAFAADTLGTVEARLSLADHYIGRGRADEARRLLEALAGDERARAAAETRLASLLYVEGRTSEAHRLLDEVLSRNPNDSAALLQSARWLLAEGKPEAALRRTVGANPRLTATHYIRGQAQALTRRPAAAIKSFAEVLRLDPAAVDARIELARLHLQAHTADSAVLFAEEAVAQAPERVDARLALIRAWIARGNIRRAEAELAVVMRQAATPAVHVVDGVLRMQAGDHRAARAAFVRALARDAASIEALSGLVAVDALRGADMRDARARVESQLAARPDHRELLLLAAKAALAARDTARAEALLRRSIAVDPLAVENFALLAKLLAEERRVDDALRSFDEAARQNPQDVGARTMGAVLRHTQGDLAGAAARYQEVLQVDPRATVAANNLAAILADRGENLAYAQQLADAAAEQVPGDPEIQDTLGRVYQQRGIPGLAIQQFQKSVAIAPANAQYRYRLGLAYSLNGDTTRAREAFEKALQLDPQLQPARSALAAIGT